MKLRPTKQSWCLALVLGADSLLAGCATIERDVQQARPAPALARETLGLVGVAAVTNGLAWCLDLPLNRKEALQEAVGHGAFWWAEQGLAAR